MEVAETREKNAIWKRRNQFFAAFVAGIGIFGMGSVIAWTSPALPDLEKSEKFGNMSSSENEWIAPIMPLASLVAGPVVGLLIEQFGRKRIMIILTIPFSIGWLVIALAENVAMIYAGRALTGFCAGSYSLMSPIFVSEIAQDDIRGTLGSVCQILTTTGILYTYIVGSFVSWNTLALINAFIPACLFILMFFVPESPRYLLNKGETLEAMNSLCWFRCEKLSENVEAEKEIMQKAIDEAKLLNATWKDIFSPAIRKPTLIILLLMLFQQLSGIDAVIFYTVQIFEDAGTDIDPNLSTIIIGTVQVCAFFLSLILIDRIGRRILLIASDSVMALSLMLMGLFFKLRANDESIKDSIGWLPLLSLIMFMIAFSIGFGPLPFIMLGEVLPNHVVGMTAGISICLNWTLVFLVTFFFERFQEFMGIDWTYWMFSMVCLIGTAFVVFFVPETKGKSLEEIQKNFID